MTAETEKKVHKYAKLYGDTLNRKNFPEAAAKQQRYIECLTRMYNSPAFAEHNVYPSMDTALIYAVIAMCLELRDYGLSDEEIIEFTDTAFQKRKKFFDVIIRTIDLLPGSFKIVRKWNINDHAKRVKDGSITYDQFDVTDSSVRYRISKCMYAEMFAYYGIRQLCRIFCNTDTRSYENLTRHVRFIRHSDLSSGDSCDDEIYRK